MSDLTPKQQRFVEEYLIDLNATQAAVRAGYSPKTAKQQGQRLLTNVDVQAAVTEAKDRRAERTELAQDDVVRELATIGFANAGDFFDWGPDGVKVKEKDHLTVEQRAVVAEVSQTVTEKGGTIRVKLHDKLSALEKLGRHLGMFTENVNLGGSIGIRHEDALKDLE